MTSLLSFTPSTPSIYLPLSLTCAIIIASAPPPSLSATRIPSHVSMSSTVRRMLPTPVPFRLRPTRRRRWPLAGRWSHRVCSRRRLRPRPLLRQSHAAKPSPAEFKQKIGAYIVWAALHAFLANFQNSTSTAARYFASVVPLVNCLRLLLHGLSIVTNEGLELLRGPLYYVLILILCALAFWRESPVGVVSLAMMCGGDGVADIMGRKFGSIKIPYNQKKSWAGSISMFLFGFVISIGMLYYYSFLGYFQLNWVETVEKVALISLVATIVESLPITDVLDDNISVPLVSMAAAYLSFSL
ncbi:vitamin E pathway gene 5 [Prunus dulcis]|uniref:phytol kinase n=1 Tax=Prunus dulcis TaxID=3755 RepID=A0A4Y1QYX5_PRUDU|nr:vitamin E pathway gene 5 [Prunus dulcis]